MGQRPLTELTEDEKVARRAYQAQKKRESRDRQREAGECIERGTNCEGKAKPGGTTCRACDQAAADRARRRAHEQGRWPIIPSKLIPRTIRKLRRAGQTVNDILQDPYLKQYDVKRDEVTDILREAGLLD